MAQIENRHRVLVAYSGTGSTAGAVFEAQKNNFLDGLDIVGAMASNDKPDTGKAFKKHLDRYPFLSDGIKVINPYHFKNADGANDRNLYGNAILEYMHEIGADSVALLGYIPKLPDVVIENSKWVINQHPGPLDPGRIDQATGQQLDFGGEGMRGSAVTCARIVYAWATGDNYWTEATMHFVTPHEGHDRGELVNTSKLDIRWAIPSVLGWVNPPTINEIWDKYRDGLRHTTKEVQDALLPIEHANVIEAFKKFEGGRIPKGFTREVPLIKSGKEQILFDSKKLGIKMAPRGQLIAI